LGGIPTDKRITIEDNGRVYGYVALWDTCHVGLGGCVKPPKGSPTDYQYAHQGETVANDGSVVRTAVIAGGGNHAPVNMEKAFVPAYYENTGTQLMRVRYGEDENGLWFAGALWPDVSELQIAQIKASSVSGDWRWHAAWRETDSGFDLAGACFVNIPGYPMPTEGSVDSRAGRMRQLAASMGSGWIVTDGEVTMETADIDEGGTEMDDETEVTTQEPVITADAGEEAAKPEGHQCTCDGCTCRPKEPSELIASLTQRFDEFTQGVTQRMDKFEADQLARDLTSE
jgi:hypothetical protein